MTLPTTFSPVLTGQSYAPTGTTPNTRQYGNYFRGSGKRPVDGRPVLLHCGMVGWATSSRATQFTALGSNVADGSTLQTDGLPWLALRAGWDVFSIACTVTNQVDAAGAVISGKGLYRREADTDGGVVNLFQTKSFPEKDLCWATQYLRNHALTLGCNPDLIVAKGASAAPVLWPTLNQDYAGSTGFHTGGSTRPTAAIALAPQALFPLIGSTQSAVFTNHFPRETGTPATDWQNVALAYTGAAGFDASNNGTDWTRAERASAVRYAWDPAISGAEDINALNATVPLYLYAGVAVPTSAPFAADPPFSVTPAAVNWLATNYSPLYGGLDIAGEDPFHSSTHIYAFKEIAAANGMLWSGSGSVSRLVVAAIAKETASWGAAKPRADLVIDGLDKSGYGPHAQDQLEWMLALARRL